MSRNQKQTEIPMFNDPILYRAEIYYQSNDGEECLEVKNLTFRDIECLKNMFKAHKIIIEKN